MILLSFFYSNRISGDYYRFVHCKLRHFVQCHFLNHRLPNFQLEFLAQHQLHRMFHFATVVKDCSASIAFYCLEVKFHLQKQSHLSTFQTSVECIHTLVPGVNGMYFFPGWSVSFLIKEWSICGSICRQFTLTTHSKSQVA